MKQCSSAKAGILFVTEFVLVLHGSVGAGGRNSRIDVQKVQSLLAAGGWHLGLIDGVCGRRTLSAIVAFQRHFMHHPVGLVEPQGRSWRALSHPQHRQTGYKSLNHATAEAPAPAQVAPTVGARGSAPAHQSRSPRAVPQARAIQLTSKDILNLKKTLQTEWVAFAGNDQAYGIIDTILNRLASGHWGSTIADVVNARNQFSDINGPPPGRGPTISGSVRTIGSNRSRTRTSRRAPTSWWMRI